MLLCIDVGNTEPKLGAFAPGGALVGTWRVTTARRRTADEFGVLFSAFFSTARFAIADVEAIGVSSVVPVVDRPLGEGCEKYFGVKPQFFTAANQHAIVVKTDRPREAGSDLIAAAFLFHPRGAFVLEQAWTEPLAIPFLGGFVLLVHLLLLRHLSLSVLPFLSSLSHCPCCPHCVLSSL